MKKCLIIFFVIVCSVGVRCQNPFLRWMFDDMWYSNGRELLEIGLTYSHMNADNSFKETMAQHSSWNAIGLTCSQYAFVQHSFCGYFSCFVDYAWATKSDNSMFNTNVSFNFGYNLLIDSLRLLFLIPHIGIGCNFDVMDMNDKNSYYYDESYYQYSGVFPIGFKVKYKHLFADFTYMIRFVRSKIHYFDDYQWDYYDLYKSQKNVATHITIFPFILSVGWGF